MASEPASEKSLRPRLFRRKERTHLARLKFLTGPLPQKCASGASALAMPSRSCTGAYPLLSAPFYRLEARFQSGWSCGHGGTGRRATLRSLWPKGRGSSSLLGRTTQHRYNLLVPQACQRIGSGAVVTHLLARSWWSRIALEAAAGRHRDTGHHRSGRLRADNACCHVKPHLLVVDMSTRHRPLPHEEGRCRDRPAGEAKAVGGSAPARAMPSRKRTPNRSS
jgi:hypothetical protein